MNPQTSRRFFLRFAGLAASVPLLSENHLAWAAMQQAPTAPPPPPPPPPADEPSAAQKEFIMLYLLMIKDAHTYNPSSTAFASGAAITTKIATDVQAATGSNWNWNSLTPEKAAAIAQAARNTSNPGAFLTVSSAFQASAGSMGWPGGGGTHPCAGEMVKGLGIAT